MITAIWSRNNQNAVSDQNVEDWYRRQKNYLVANDKGFVWVATDTMLTRLRIGSIEDKFDLEVLVDGRTIPVHSDGSLDEWPSELQTPLDLLSKLVEYQ